MPTATWKSRLRSGSAHWICNSRLRSGTGVWSSRWRSGCAHWDLDCEEEAAGEEEAEEAEEEEKSPVKI